MTSTYTTISCTWLNKTLVCFDFSSHSFHVFTPSMPDLLFLSFISCPSSSSIFFHTLSYNLVLATNSAPLIPQPTEYVPHYWEEGLYALINCHLGVWLSGVIHGYDTGFDNFCLPIIFSTPVEARIRSLLQLHRRIALKSCRICLLLPLNLI